MNPFDLKAALLEKHVQHPIINPHTNGVEHGPTVWLADSKLPPSRVRAQNGAITFTCRRSVIFVITIRNISRGFQSRDMYAGVLAFLETIN
jgi:hypothetical protein